MVNGDPVIRLNVGLKIEELYVLLSIIVMKYQHLSRFLSGLHRRNCSVVRWRNMRVAVVSQRSILISPVITLLISSVTSTLQCVWPYSLLSDAFLCFSACGPADRLRPHPWTHCWRPQSVVLWESRRQFCDVSVLSLQCFTSYERAWLWGFLLVRAV